MNPVPRSRPRLLPTLLIAASLAGCAAERAVTLPPPPPQILTPPAWPTLAACRQALSGKPERACVRLDVENTLSRAFIFRALRVEIDGAIVFRRQERRNVRGQLDAERAFTVYLDQVPSGPHVLQLVAQLDSDAEVVPEYPGYLFELRSSHSLQMPAGSGARVRIVLHEKAGRSIEEALAARYDEEPAW